MQNGSPLKNHPQPSGAGQLDPRLRRILIIALFFVFTALPRLFKGEHYLDFLTALLDVQVGSSKYAAAQDADLIIFYNLYIPHDSEGITNAIEVINDQIGQISEELRRIEEGGSSGGDGNGKKINEKGGVIFYNLIGNEDAFTSDKMRDLCHQLHPRLDCHLLQHYEEGSEAVTLQDVYDFCSSDDVVKDANQTRVVYLHSKGSYHSQKANHIWRRVMTSASLHPDCLNPPNATCDVCGAQFYIKYAIMFPGNMWTAKCSYVRKLIPPNEGEYEKRKRDAIKQFLMLRLWGVLQATLDTNNVEHFGMDRYQWEHWIASHPSILPCEVHTTDVGPLILLGEDREKRTFIPEYYDWGMAPRRISSNLGGLREPRIRLEKNPDLAFREYYFLAGNMLKWLTIYGPDGVPAQDSWVFRHFPAGERWKEVAAQHGAKAIDAVVESSNPRFHSAFQFAWNHSDMGGASSSAELFDDEILSHSDPPLVVFYQIIAMRTKNTERVLADIKSQFDALSMGEYDNVTKSFDQQRKILLYYTIAGGEQEEIGFVSNICREMSDRIKCHMLGRYDSTEVIGETLHQLHSFCNAMPSFNVIYITNLARLDAPKVHAATTAVMSKMCRPSATCNVCGTEFYPLPFLHFTGNIFSASCGYVKDLLPPPMFEEKMNDIAGDALLAQLHEIFTTKQLRFDAQILGSYQHSIEHWIGSHPDLKPCDVAPIDVQKSDDPMLEQMKQYSWSLAPRRGSAPPGYIPEENESKFRARREVALREYYYLAGNIFRWHRLYSKVPDAGSWAWQWFPDGKLWEAAARKSGSDALYEIARQLNSEEADVTLREIW